MDEPESTDSLADSDASSETDDTSAEEASGEDDDVDSEMRRLEWGGSCRLYRSQEFCDLQRHCSWVGDNHWVGTCLAKAVHRCSEHSTEYACGGTGRDGRPCTWIGNSPQVGTCQEKAAPTPSPVPAPVICTMFYAASSCPAGCHWNGRKCQQQRVFCGMCYSE